MRILAISNYYPPLELGGWPQLTENNVFSLKKRGHEVMVLTSRYQIEQLETSEQGVLRSLHLESPDHEHYHVSYTWEHRFWEIQNQDNLSRIASNFMPDIIFINGMWNLPVSLAKKAEQLFPGRVIYYMASLWPVEIDAHSAYWSSEAAKTYLRFPKKIFSQIIKNTIITGTPRNCLDFPLVLCVSDYVRQIMIREAAIPKERTRVVHNGVEIDHLIKREPLRITNPLRLIFAGRLSPEKGVHTAIESLSHLHQKSPDLQFYLSIYGEGPGEYETKLKNLIRESNLEDKIKCFGWVSREEMLKILPNHDVLLFPSICHDALARILQEAMACGLVVIGTMTGGTPEILEEGKNGLTFEVGNAEQLAEKISYIAKDTKIYARLASAAIKTVEEKFTLEGMVDNLERYFFETAGRN